MRRARRVFLATTVLVGVGGTSAPESVEQKPLRVMATLTPYREIATEIAGERAEVEAIAAARQDAHFVQAKPSFAVSLRGADLLVATGLDLELWLPALIDKSRNPKIREGEVGYVSVASGIRMLEVPSNPSRAAGDIHIFGNPHVHADPLRAVIVAENIKVGFQNVDPQNRSFYEERFLDFERRIHMRLFGRELVELVGGDKLAELAMRHELSPFLANNRMGGEALSTLLGGWMRQAECLRGKRIVAYHLNWIYFTDRFGIDIAAYVERRPGIPPSASHAADLIELIRSEDIRVLWVADYFDQRIPKLIAERTGAQFLYVPLYTGATESTGNYFSLIDVWIARLRSAYPECSAELRP